MGFLNKYYKGKLKNLESGVVNENKIASNLEKHLKLKYKSKKLSKKRKNKKKLIEKTIKLLKEYKNLKDNFIFEIPIPDKNGFINVRFPHTNKIIKLKILNNQKPGNKMTVSVPKKKTKYKIKVSNKLNNKREMKIMTPFGEKLHLKIPSNKKVGDDYFYYSYKVKVPDNLVQGDQFYAIINDNTPLLLNVTENKKSGDILEFVDQLKKRITNENHYTVNKKSIGPITNNINTKAIKALKIKKLLKLTGRILSNRNINKIFEELSIQDIDDLISNEYPQPDSNVNRISQKGIYNHLPKASANTSSFVRSNSLGLTRKPQNININRIRKLCKMDGHLIFNIEHIEYLLGLRTLKKTKFVSLNQDKYKKEILQEINKQLDHDSIIKLRKLYNLMINVNYQNKRNYSAKDNSYRNFYRYLIEMIKEQKISMCILNTFITYLFTETSGSIQKNSEYQRNLKNLIKEIKNREIRERREILKTF